MNHYFKKKIFLILCIVCLVVFLLPNFTVFFNIVYADEITYFNELSFKHRDTITPGTAIKIPEEIKQYPAQCESYLDTGFGSKPPSAQYDVRHFLWEAQGSPETSDHFATVTVAGQERYLIALSTTFGWSGDYVDILLKDGTVVPCFIGDSKDINDKESATNDGAYFYNGVHYGHTYEGDKCDIVEFILSSYGGQGIPNFNREFAAKFDQVAAIINGGNYFLHPDGPIGLDGSYSSLDSNTEDGDINDSDEYNTLDGAIIASFRELLNSFLTEISNARNGRDDATVKYFFRKEFNSNSGSNANNNVNSFNSDILETCRKVTEEMLNRNVTYSTNKEDEIPLDPGGDIERCYKESKSICCATYSSIVLYLSGRLTAEQINKFNYHYTGDLPNMFEAAGLKKISWEEAVPGDIYVNRPGGFYDGEHCGHVMILANKDTGDCWDQNSCCDGGNGGTTVKHSEDYLSDTGYGTEGLPSSWWSTH